MNVIAPRKQQFSERNFHRKDYRIGTAQNMSVYIETPPQICCCLFSRSCASCSTDTVLFMWCLLQPTMGLVEYCELHGCLQELAKGVGVSYRRGAAGADSGICVKGASPPFPFPSLPFPFSSLSPLFHYLPLPLEVGPFKPARGSGGAL